MFYLTSWNIKRIKKKIKAMQANRVNNQPTDELIKKEVAYYYELATLYKKHGKNKNSPYPDILINECYTAAANLDDAKAHFYLGKNLLDEAKYRHSLEIEAIFNSEANLEYMQRIFKEALLHLEAAEALGHIEAKRLRGLCFINGWGVVEDKDTGFELVVASIEQEESWDRVPQIFASMGLNKPEFFAAIMQRRKN